MNSPWNNPDAAKLQQEVEATEDPIDMFIDCEIEAVKRTKQSSGGIAEIAMLEAFRQYKNVYGQEAILMFCYSVGTILNCLVDTCSLKKEDGQGISEEEAKREMLAAIYKTLHLHA